MEKAIPPRKGKRQLARIIESILFHQPAGKTTSIAPALAFLGKVAKRRSVIFLISDFLTDENILTPLKVVSLRHDIVLIRISDRWERELPKVGLVEIEDPETGTLLLVDTSDPIVRAEYQKLRAQYDSQLTRAKHQSGIGLIELTTGEGFIRPLLAFLRAKRGARRRRRG